MLKVKNLTHLSQKRREFWLLGVIALSKNKTIDCSKFKILEMWTEKVCSDQ